MSLSANIEPDPDLDGMLDLELRRETYRHQIADLIKSGVFSSRRIIRKLYDPDDPQFTKQDLQQMIYDVQASLKEEWSKRDLSNDVVAFLEHNESLIEDAAILADRCDRPRDRVAAINTIAGLWKDRMGFLKDVGANLRSNMDFDEKNRQAIANSSNARSKKAEKLYEDADAIEAEFTEVDDEKVN